MLLKYGVILADLGIVGLTILYLRIFPSEARRYILPFSFISFIVSVFLLWLALFLPRSEVIVAIVLVLYCSLAASLNLQLRAKGLGASFSLPSHLTPVLASFLVGMLVIGLVMIVIASRYRSAP